MCGMQLDARCRLASHITTICIHPSQQSKNQKLIA